MSTIKANTLLHSDGSTTTQPSIPALDKRMAKAWVAFNGTGTVAIRDSYNVSSITDVSTGYYTVNFTTNMTDGNYMVATSNRWDDRFIGTYHGYNITTSFQINSSTNGSTTPTDADTVQAVVFAS